MTLERGTISFFTLFHSSTRTQCADSYETQLLPFLTPTGWSSSRVAGSRSRPSPRPRSPSARSATPATGSHNAGLFDFRCYHSLCSNTQSSAGICRLHGCPFLFVVSSNILIEIPLNSTCFVRICPDTQLVSIFTTNSTRFPCLGSAMILLSRSSGGRPVSLTVAARAPPAKTESNCRCGSH